MVDIGDVQKMEEIATKSREIVNKVDMVTQSIARVHFAAKTQKTFPVRIDGHNLYMDIPEVIEILESYLKKKERELEEIYRQFFLIGFLRTRALQQRKVD